MLQEVRGVHRTRKASRSQNSPAGMYGTTMGITKDFVEQKMDSETM